jgi:hypothetical protein
MSNNGNDKNYKATFMKRVYNERTDNQILDEKERKHNEYVTRKRNRRESTVQNASLSSISIDWDFDNYCTE